MAELNLGKGLTAGKVASNVQKKLTRAQEKVLQKLGKADETKDVAFEEEVINFNKQYVNPYLHVQSCTCGCGNTHHNQISIDNVQSCLADMYEPEWSGKNEVDSIVEDCDVLWTDYHQKLVSNSLISMDTYLGQFPDIKSRIAKRDRKLVDYDSARHNYATTHKTKKKDGGIKITKAEDELDRAQKVFEEINIDLQEELPSLWNRCVCVCDCLWKWFSVGGLSLLSLRVTVITCHLRPPRIVVKEASNHTLRPGGPPPIPKSPSKLRPAMPPPPKVTPCKEMKTENIISLFDAAATPDINVTSPTEVSEQLLSTNSHSPLTFHSPALVRAFKYSFVWPAPLPTFIPIRYDPIAAATEGWGDDGTLPARYDPVAPAQEGGGDDEDQQVHCDPEAEAQEDRGDDCDQLVTEVPTPEDETPAAEAPAEVAEEDTTPAAATLDDEEGQVTEGRKKMEMHLDEKWSMHRFLRRRFEHETPEVAKESTEVVASDPEEMPAGFLFKVMHDYAANDTDELEMKTGDVVLVIKFDNPDEQDDGWLMGMTQDDWLQNKENAAKGVFPENFTQRL
uniref:Myc box-dependent-interacting protein 1 n=1 Tax=Cyclopterus lumpus TaxID=8103 RepID=A0A8C3AZD5_CYCLU